MAGVPRAGGEHHDQRVRQGASQLATDAASGLPGAGPRSPSSPPHPGRRQRRPPVRVPPPGRHQPGLNKQLHWWPESLEHRVEDAYWTETSPSERLADITTPGLHVGGWFDFFVPETTRAFTRLRNEARLLEIQVSEATNGVAPWGNPDPVLPGFGAFVDGRIIPRHPFADGVAPFSAGKPLMVGTTRDETVFFSLFGPKDIFSIDDTGLRSRLSNAYQGAELDRIIATFRRSRPQATPAQLYFAITTSPIWRDAITITELESVSVRTASRQTGSGTPSSTPWHDPNRRVARGSRHTGAGASRT
ncbi:CocE/NonD family hydrolase [Catenuloplanes sp. NPDC051500]|uniref:CocE/NonD family hydrolase n=1 Tax=Catenuloplanes sp. NPDC051500 TaxID=3363959 RepID=UPI0037B28A25